MHTRNPLPQPIPGPGGASLTDRFCPSGKGVNGSFHAADGTPLINTETFPSMSDMTAHGHKLGMRVGWYVLYAVCFVYP